MKNWLLIVFCVLVFNTCSFVLKGQEKPPKPITLELSSASGIDFGAFAINPVYNSGGTVQVSWGGMRTVSGGLIEIHQFNPHHPATFKIIGNVGTAITIADAPSGGYPLSNGTQSIYVKFNFQTDAQFGKTFVLTQDPFFFNVGGTLYVGNDSANPPGNYSGLIPITVVQQ